MKESIQRSIQEAELCVAVIQPALYLESHSHQHWLKTNPVAEERDSDNMFSFYYASQQWDAHESSDLMKLICVFLSMRAAASDRKTGII